MLLLERKLLLLVLQLIYLSPVSRNIQKLADVYTQYQHFDVLSPTILNSIVSDFQYTEASFEDRNYLNDLKQI